MHDRSKTMCENVKPGRDPQGPATPAGKNRFPTLHIAARPQGQAATALLRAPALLGASALIGVSATHTHADIIAASNRHSPILAAEGLPTLIADGEGDASSHLLEWTRRGLIDVVQYDVRHPGFSRWLELGPMLDSW